MVQLENIPSDVDNDVRVRILGQGLRDDRLSASKGTGNGGGTSLDTAIFTRNRFVVNILVSKLGLLGLYVMSAVAAYGNKASRTRWPVKRG